jgi:outer membrane protein insertion porin family
MRSLSAFLLAVLVPTLAAAQSQVPSASPHIGKTIAGIQMVREGRPADDPTLVDLLETRVGQPLSTAAVRESIAHLFSLGRYQDVQVEAVEVPGGVSLRYHLVPVHNVTRVEFSGDLGVSKGDLRQFLEDRFGRTPAVGRAGDVVSALERQFYPESGYMRASVKWTPTVVHDPDRTFLTLEIDAGPRAAIRDVEIVGDLLEGRAAFERQVHAAKGDSYQPARIRSGLAEYTNKLQKRGRYEATATFVPTVSDDGTAVDLRFTVVPGPIVRVVFRGDPLPPDRIKELVPVEREGSVDQDLLEDSARRITDYLNEQGYWKATAASAPEEKDGTLDIVFTVHKGLEYHVEPGGVLITGNREVALELLRPFLDELQPGAVYVASNLGAAVSAMADFYRRRGFASISVQAAANELNPTPAGLGQVQPAIAIAEGPRTVVGDVTFAGNEHLSAEQLRALVKAVPHGAYYEPDIEADRQAVELAYRNVGYSSVNVVIKPVLSDDRSRADLQFQIAEGPQTIVDHIIIVGNTRTDPRIIQRELAIETGKPLGMEDRYESQRRLQALGLFRRVRIDELPHGGGSRRDVLVAVEEAAATTLTYGGGLEISQRLRATGPSGEAESHLEFAPRGFFDIGRRNIAGKNRSVNLYTRLSLRPRDVPADPARDGTGFGFSEYRIVAMYREPRALGMRAADLTVTGALEQGVRSSFNFKRQGVNADLVRPFGSRVRVSGRYSFSYTETLDERLSEEEQANIDRIFPQVRLSSFASAISYDTRDDVVDPTSGGFLSAEATLAARALGGQVGFLKAYTQGSWFQRFPGKRRIVLATRAVLGLADGFPSTVLTTAVDGAEQEDVIEDLPASERFFAGGNTTIRGFANDTVGAPNTISAAGFPKGGNAVLIMNAELRFPVWRDFGAAVFVDGGNVFSRVTEFDFGELRGSYGLGLRYRSSLGPVRLDIGFAMDRRQLGEKLEPGHAWHFSIGHAF